MLVAEDDLFLVIGRLVGLLEKYALGLESLVIQVNKDLRTGRLTVHLIEYLFLPSLETEITQQLLVLIALL